MDNNETEKLTINFRKGSVNPLGSDWQLPRGKNVCYVERKRSRRKWMGALKPLR